jgi:diguanylate cyclase (GGDEF)-like protein
MREDPMVETGPATKGMRLGSQLIGGLGAVAILGFLDYATGREISFSIFYLAPVGLVAWFAGRGAGLVVGLVAAAVWGVVEGYGGAAYSSPLIPFWNTLVRLGFFIITAWLIAEVRRVHLRERELARIDSLTGAANARLFVEAVEREIARMDRSGGTLTLAYVDLDRFKTVNDMLGHAAGDALLQAVAGRLVATLRAVDVVARLGGDEFALLLPDTGGTAASVALGRCLEAVRDAVRGVPGGLEEVSATIGGIVFRRPPRSVQAAIRAADDLMYQAKRAGRNRLFMADAESQEDPEASGLP